MNSIRLGAAILLVVLLSGFAPETWVKIQPKENAFSVEFPRKPEESERKIQTEIGELNMNILMYEVGKFKDENSVYGLIYSDYPDSLVNSDFKDEYIDEFFENAIKGTVNNLKGQIIEEKRVLLSTYPGREVKISFMEGQGIMKLHVYLVKNRAYILEVGCETKNDNNKSMDRFFNSFVLKEKK
jgi:hypothetical protein